MVSAEPFSGSFRKISVISNTILVWKLWNYILIHCVDKSKIRTFLLPVVQVTEAFSWKKLLLNGKTRFLN